MLKTLSMFTFLSSRGSILFLSFRVENFKHVYIFIFEMQLQHYRSSRVRTSMDFAPICHVPIVQHSSSDHFTQFGLAMPYNDREIGQHRLR